MAGSNSQIERILLIRLSALGDCLAAVPVFHALREHYPKAHIAWAIQDNFAPLIQTLPGLDEIIVFPRQRWRRMRSLIPKWIEFRQFARHLRLRRFDVTVDVQSNSKSAMIAALSHCRDRIGHGYGEAKEISMGLNTHFIYPPTGMEHIVLKNLYLLRGLGIEASEPDFTLPPDPLAQRRIRQWLSSKRISEKGYVLLVPFSGDPMKEWAPDKYSELARELAEDGPAVVFLNGPGKEQETQAMIPALRGKRVFLGPRTEILEMVELSRMAQVAVGSDTGPIQIAGAFGVPTVALFGPTDPKRSHPWGPTQVRTLEVSANTVRLDVLRFMESDV